MNTINNAADLKLAIEQQEAKQVIERDLLKKEYEMICDRLNPLQIIKSSFNELIAAPDLKTDLVKAAVGLTTGIVAKKLVIGKTLNPFKKLLGVLLEMAVAGTVARNTDAIKSAGESLFKSLFSGKTEKATP